MNKSLVLAMCDVLVLSAMSLNTGGLDVSMRKTSNVKPIPQWLGETNDVSAILKELEEFKKKVVRLRDVTNAYVMLSGKYEQAMNSLTSATNAYILLSNKFTHATKTIEALTSRIDSAFGTGLVSRRNLIKSCVYGIYVSYGGGKGATYYSPLVEIGQGTYVVVYLPHAQVMKIKNVSVLQGSGVNDWNPIGTCESVWGIDEDEDVIFFKVKDESEKQLAKLSLGILTDETLDHFYWFQDDNAKYATIMSANSIEALKQHINVKPGALLISENHASIIKMSVPRLKIAKGEVSFIGMTEGKLKKLRGIPP